MVKEERPKWVERRREGEEQERQGKKEAMLKEGTREEEGTKISVWKGKAD